MRFSAPRVSKAVAAVALMAVGALIAVSLLADVRGASAQMEERLCDIYDAAFCIEENKTAAAGETLIRVGKVKIPDGEGNVLDTKYVIVQGSDNPIVDGVETFQLNPPGKDSGDNRNVLWATRPLNFEAKVTYLFIIASSDSIYPEDVINIVVRVDVVDVNEPPFFVREDLDRMSDDQALAYCSRDMSAIELTNPPIIRINENAAIGSVLTDYDACDPDASDVVRFQLSSDSAYFDIHNGTGQLRVAGPLDYELKPTYTIEVEVADAEFVERLTQRIHLNNINEPVTPTPTRTAAPTPIPTRTAAPTATPTTTPGRVSQDVLHRVGALEQLLARLQTLIQSLQGVIAAQDSRIAAQDDKIAAQDGRIAALEAQMAAGALTPTPQPTATATPSPTPTMTPEPMAAASACVQAMRPGSVSGSWTSGCLTANPTHGNTYYARFYTFTLDAAADVTITLSSDKPPYLYLLAGAGTSGDVLRQAGGDGQTSVAITDTLRAGSYTIEASTWRPKTLGDFTLTLTARE